MYGTPARISLSTKGKRSRLRLCLDVLGVIRKGAEKPTNIMYRSNLSWVPLTEILNLLEDKGLIESRVTGKRRVYKITKRGLDLLEYFQKAEVLLAAAGGRSL